MSIAALGLTTPVFAQSTNYAALPEASTLRNPLPAALRDDEGLVLGFYPAVSISYTRQTNVLRSKTNERSDYRLMITPTLAYIREIGRHRYQIQYRGDYFSFQNLKNENAIDHNIQGGIALDLTETLDARLRAGYTKGHEARGAAGARVSTSPEPDRFEEVSFGGGLTLGRRTSMLQLAGAMGISELRYVNNDQGARDRDSDSISGTVYYNLRPKTAVLFAVNRKTIDYIHPASGLNLDSTETGYHAGVTWEATAITTGLIKVGYTEKDLDDPTLKDYSGGTYEGRVRWRPRPFSTFEFYTARSTAESTEGTSSFIVSDQLGGGWNHQLSERWRVNAFADRIQDEFSSGRKDNIVNYGVGVGYNMLMWLDLAARYARAKRTSDFEDANYEDELFVLSMTATRR